MAKTSKKAQEFADLKARIYAEALTGGEFVGAIGVEIGPSSAARRRAIAELLVEGKIRVWLADARSLRMCGTDKARARRSRATP